MQAIFIENLPHITHCAGADYMLINEIKMIPAAVELI